MTARKRMTVNHLPPRSKCSFVSARYANNAAINGVARCNQPARIKMPAIKKSEKRRGILGATCVFEGGAMTYLYTLGSRQMPAAVYETLVSGRQRVPVAPCSNHPQPLGYHSAKSSFQ